MKMEDHDEDDGRKVWLRPAELDVLLDETDSTAQQIGLGLMARCAFGLPRRST